MGSRSYGMLAMGDISALGTRNTLPNSSYHELYKRMYNKS
jgi:hypothetical protein